MSPLAITLFALAAVACAAPIEETTPIPILKQSADGPNPDGSYSYNYETGNGIAVEEQGFVKVIDQETQAMEAQGGYSYTGPDGVLYKIVYVANENGFQPQGEHLPTPPPVPPQILRALEYIAAHPEENNADQH